MEKTLNLEQKMTDTATIKRTAGGPTDAHRWLYRIYVAGRVLRFNHFPHTRRDNTGTPYEVFGLNEARQIALTAKGISAVRYAWR